MIAAAYRRLMKDAHPDAGGDAERAKRLNRAYEVLSTPESRARYDATLPSVTATPSLSQAVAYRLGVRIGRYAARLGRSMRDPERRGTPKG